VRTALGPFDSLTSVDSFRAGCSAVGVQNRVGAWPISVYTGQMWAGVGTQELETGIFAAVTGRRKIAPKMGQEDYIRVNRGPNRMDSRVAGAHASCYGVNLASAGLGVRRSSFGRVSLQAVRAVPRHGSCLG
jgi:hypothetical protein